MNVPKTVPKNVPKKNIKGHKSKKELKKSAKVAQQKGRRVPLQLQTAVEAEILKERHIRRVENINDEMFIHSAVTTVKRREPLKVALESRSLNKAFQKENTKCRTLTS